MKVSKWLVIVMLSFNFISCGAVTKLHTPLPGFKKVWIYGNTVSPSSVVIILSGDGGWVLGVTQVARALAKENVMVIGVNCMPYLRYLKKQNVDCYDMSKDIEKLSSHIQTTYHLANYQKPVILGYSLGATLAYGILAQAPADTYKGAISLGFCYDLETPKPLCKGSGLESKKREKKGYDLQPVSYLKQPFFILQGANDRMCKFCLAKDFVDKTPNAQIVELPDIRHGSLGLRKWIPTVLEVYKKVINEKN
ncbi:MAG TPA: AcvB/VirJ family lysyl-phosphatidylglycerol hydrolase [Bacteroidales bacterium]